MCTRKTSFFPSKFKDELFLGWSSSILTSTLVRSSGSTSRFSMDSSLLFTTTSIRRPQFPTSPLKILECIFTLLRLVYPSVRDKLEEAIGDADRKNRNALGNVQPLFDFFSQW